MLENLKVTETYDKGVTILILYSHLYLDLPGGHFPSCFPPKVYAFLISSMHFECSASLVLVDLITLIKCMKSTKYESCYMIFCIILLFPLSWVKMFSSLLCICTSPLCDLPVG